MREGSDNMSTPITVALDHLTIGYQARDEVRTVAVDLNATVPPCAVTCLLGPNGAGKSTLMRTMAGLLHPLSGSVTIDNTPVGKLHPHELARKIGVVLTGRASANAMTIEELVALGRTPYTNYWGHLTDNDRRIVDEAISRIGAHTLRHRLVTSLSDGEMQRIMIAKTLAQQTPVIILDEPTAFLDFPGKVGLMKLLHKLATEERKTVFLSTHDLDIALATADNLWLLDRSGALETGDVASIGASGSLDRLFAADGLKYNPKLRHFEIFEPKRL